LHPFIEKYIQSVYFPYKEWEPFLSKDQILENAIFNLTKVINVFDDTKLDVENLDNALICGHNDNNMFLFFISISIGCLTQKQQLDKARSFISIGENLIDSELQPEIQSLFLQAASRICIYTGEMHKEKRLLYKSLSLLNKEMPKYRNNLVNFSLFLARKGMLNELEPADLKLLTDRVNNQYEKDSLVTEVLLANSINQGDVQNGFVHLKNYLKGHDGKSNSRYENAKFSLNILLGKDGQKIYSLPEFEKVAIIFEDFYENRVSILPEKIKFLKSIEIENPFIHFLTCYLPLHFELNQKNLGKAKLILHENSLTGKVHFLDDLFFARIALLENKRADALYFMKRLLPNIEKYHYEQRMAFEMKFVREVSLADFYFLLQKAYEFKSQNLPLEEVKVILPLVEKKGLDLIVGESRVIKKTKELIRKYAAIHEPILVTGETGTGKELVAKAIHDIGPNFKEPFLAINCGALTDTLLQSELFGYEAGAFTGAQKEKKGIFEAAGKGTVFLDEFEDVSTKMQSSLLRVLETSEIRMIGGTKSRKINCKIVIATNIELKSLVGQKVFREDLYFRLSRFEIKLPSLSVRKSDIPNLIEHFLQTNREGEIAPVIEDKLLEILSDYSWPGNIRELRNAVERMKILHSDKNIYGVEEFDFDQLEKFSKPTNVTIERVIDKREEPESAPTANSKEEMERIQDILKSVLKFNQE
jgi:transcriptional regulator with PAS, ATPase and Fis domain